MKEQIIKKLTSRKFWMSVAAFVSMLLIYNGSSESEATQVVSIILAGATVIGYVLGEGLTDAFADKDSNPKIEEMY